MNAIKFLILLAFIAFANTSIAQGGDETPCQTDSLAILTDSIHWKIISNSLGKPSGVAATEITYQYNGFPGYPGAKWISCMSDWLEYTYPSNPDDSIVYRYQFTCNKKDTINLNLDIRRDNYCTVYLDGTVLLKDPVVFDPAYIDTGTLMQQTLLLDTCNHNIDIVVYNRNSFTGNNGFGLLAAGYLKSKHSALVPQTSECAGYKCVPTAVAEIQTHNGVMIYPNPANGIMYIDARNLNKNAGYVLMDITGKELIHSELIAGKINAIDMDALNAGLYLLKIDGMPGVNKIEKK